jgi:hypothetical protein
MILFLASMLHVTNYHRENTPYFALFASGKGQGRGKDRPIDKTFLIIALQRSHKIL